VFIVVSTFFVTVESKAAINGHGHAIGRSKRFHRRRNYVERNNSKELGIGGKPKHYRREE
jgi:hypothetical protein